MAEKAEKQLLTPEERRQRVREAREARVRQAFEGQKFEYVGPITLGEDERYTDVTGNKGRHGFVIKNKNSGEELVVGPTSLKKCQDVYGAITIPPKERKSRKKVEDEEAAA